MKERPILFRAPMVRAILDGRKCQTRRVVKMLPSAWCEKVKGNDWSPNEIGEWRYQEGMWYGLSGWNTMAEAYCPYGQPGDRLWVRESGWERPERTPKMMREGADTWPRFAYATDGWSDDDRADFKRWGFKVRPSIHMPRWASRILLEVTAVRVERLQDISKEDAIAEGLHQDQAGRWATWSATEKHREHLNPVEAYRELWQSINGPGSWAANPWVWVVEFKRAPA